MKITKGTLMRTIWLLLVVVNIVLERCGVDVLPTDECTILMLVEAGIEIAGIAVAFWKNNSFTEKAIKADKFLKELRESECD